MHKDFIHHFLIHSSHQSASMKGVFFSEVDHCVGIYLMKIWK